MSADRLFRVSIGRCGPAKSHVQYYLVGFYGIVPAGDWLTENPGSRYVVCLAVWLSAVRRWAASRDLEKRIDPPTHSSGTSLDECRVGSKEAAENVLLPAFHFRAVTTGGRWYCHHAIRLMPRAYCAKRSVRPGELQQCCRLLGGTRSLSCHSPFVQTLNGICHWYEQKQGCLWLIEFCDGILNTTPTPFFHPLGLQRPCAAAPMGRPGGAGRWCDVSVSSLSLQFEAPANSEPRQGLLTLQREVQGERGLGTIPWRCPRS